MKNIFTLLFLLVVTTGVSQVFYGEVLDFPENLDMTKTETYQKIATEYGGIRFERVGILDFKEDKIIFIDSQSSNSSQSNFLKMDMRFQYDFLKNSSTFSEVCGEVTILPRFFMIDQNNDKVEIQYLQLSLLPLKVKEGGFFVINTSDRTFLLVSEGNNYSTISNLYKE